MPDCFKKVELLRIFKWIIARIKDDISLTFESSQSANVGDVIKIQEYAEVKIGDNDVQKLRFTSKFKVVKVEKTKDKTYKLEVEIL